MHYFLSTTKQNRTALNFLTTYFWDKPFFFLPKISSYRSVRLIGTQSCHLENTCSSLFKGPSSLPVTTSSKCSCILTAHAYVACMITELDYELGRHFKCCSVVKNSSMTPEWRNSALVYTHALPGHEPDCVKLLQTKACTQVSLESNIIYFQLYQGDLKRESVVVAILQSNRVTEPLDFFDS